MFESIRKAVSLADKKDVPVDSIYAVCISSLNPGSGIPLNKELTPIYPGLIWNDSRAVKEAKDALSILSEAKLSTITENTSDSLIPSATSECTNVFTEI